jgi:hypothetical protein
MHLALHQGLDPVGGAADAAGVHHHVGAGADAADPVLAVAGEAREVRHQGVSALGEPVEQGGLAHVGPAHQGDDREHRRQRLGSLSAAPEIVDPPVAGMAALAPPSAAWPLRARPLGAGALPVVSTARVPSLA